MLNVKGACPMNKQKATEVMNALVDASSKVAVTVEDMRGELPDDAFKKYTKAVGEVLGSIQLDLMAPIIRIHPDLDPDR